MFFHELVKETLATENPYPCICHTAAIQVYLSPLVGERYHVRIEMRKERQTLHAAQIEGPADPLDFFLPLMGEYLTNIFRERGSHAVPLCLLSSFMISLHMGIYFL